MLNNDENINIFFICRIRVAWKSEILNHHCNNAQEHYYMVHLLRIPHHRTFTVTVYRLWNSILSNLTTLDRISQFFSSLKCSHYTDDSFGGSGSLATAMVGYMYEWMNMWVNIQKLKNKTSSWEMYNSDIYSWYKYYYLY